MIALRGMAEHRFRIVFNYQCFALSWCLYKWGLLKEGRGTCGTSPVILADVPHVLCSGLFRSVQESNEDGNEVEDVEMKMNMVMEI